MDLIKAVLEAAANGENLAVQLGTSKNYKYWKSIPDEKRCLDCERNHGKIWVKGKITKPKPPIHFFDRCQILPLETITAGTATVDGDFGADWSIMYNNILPDYYISDEDAKKQGWKKANGLQTLSPEK